MKHMTLEAIRNRWQALGVAVRAGLSADAVAAFEQRRGLSLPASVRRFYQFMDGMEEGSCDEELIFFWPLSAVGAVPEKLSGFRGIPDYGGIELSLPDAASYYIFADHSVWAHVYAMRLSGDPAAPSSVVWIGGGECWQLLANSFEEFLERYAMNPRDILFPDRLASGRPSR